MNEFITLDRPKKLEAFNIFKLELEKLQGNACLVSQKEVLPQVLERIRREQVNQIVLEDFLWLQELQIKEGLETQGVSVLSLATDMGAGGKNEHIKNLAAMDLGITFGDFIAAETGTVLLENRTHHSRLISLLPPIIIFITPLSRVFPRIEDIFNFYAQNSSNPIPTFAFYSGPSRTADIEKTLVLGVHGPRQVEVIVFEDK